MPKPCSFRPNSELNGIRPEPQIFWMPQSQKSHETSNTFQSSADSGAYRNAKSKWDVLQRPLIITYTIVGAPRYKSSTMGPKTYSNTAPILNPYSSLIVALIDPCKNPLKEASSNYSGPYSPGVPQARACPGMWLPSQGFLAATQKHYKQTEKSLNSKPSLEFRV